MMVVRELNLGFSQACLFSAAYSTALYNLRHEVYYTTYGHKWLC